MTKPRLGVLALMLEAYEPLFKGIAARQHKYVEQTIKSINEKVDFVFPKIAKNRNDIEELTAQYNSQGLDGIVIFMLSYSQGQYIVRAMQNSRLPLALALVQPDETVLDDFEEIDLTVNQGIHGAQDNANCLMRAGIRCIFFAGSRLNGELKAFAENFGYAAKTAATLRSMKIGIIGKLAGMGDVVTDDMAFYRKVGPEFVYDSIGTVQNFCAEVTQAEIDERIKYEHTVFDVDKTLTHKAHSEAVRMYLGIKKYLKAGGYSGYTAHFEEFGADGRFVQLPLLAASNLMADSYGYAAEGDATCAALGSAMNTLCGESNFTEMYMMDLKRDAILFCHAGEGNWKTARTDKKPFLANREFSEGGLANPPTPIFAPKVGKCTVLSLVHKGGESFRLVCSHGFVIDKADLTKCDMPYMFFKPDNGVRKCVEKWLENGGTHHEIVVFGDFAQRIRFLCKIMDIELVEV